MVEALYISGSGRSGSTLVERVLNASDRFVAVGEFHALWRLPFDAIVCSCGTLVARDPFWQAVLASAGIGPHDLADLRRLEGEVARFGHVRAAGFALEPLRHDADVAAYLAPQFAIFAAVAEHAGKPIVVDSSKAGPRAWLMASDPRTSVIHIYRDATDVIASWRSTKFDQGLNSAMQRPSVAAAALDWWKSEYLARRLGRVMPIGCIDYAAMCAAPAPVIAAALAAAGVPGTDRIPWRDASSVDPAPLYHSLNGNPDRFGRGAITISLKTTDFARHGRVDRLAIRAAGGALAGLYPPQR